MPRTSSRRSIEPGPQAAIAVAYVSVLFMSILDVTIVNVALPQIALDLHAGPAALGAVSVAYVIAMATVIPASGWLGDRFAGKPVLLWAAGVFTVASLLCGLARSMPELVAARVLQGLGAGALTPVGLAMLYRAYPVSQRARISATTAIVTGLAPLIGPVLGGILVTQASWRWVFIVNVPIGAGAIIFGLLWVERQPVPDAGRLDAPGLILAGTGFATLMWGLGEAGSHGWADARSWAACAGGSLILALLVVTQLHTSEPLLRLGLLRQRLFGITNLVSLFGGAAFFGALYVIALLLQDGFGLTAQEAGLTMLPEAVAVAIGAQVASRRLYPRFGPRRLLIIGLSGVATSVASMTLVDPHGGRVPPLQLVLLALLGLSWSLVFLPASVAAFARVVQDDTSRASALFSTTRQLGSAVGVALTSIALVARPTDADALRASNDVAVDFHVGLWTAAALAASAALISVFVRDADAISTLSDFRVLRNRRS